MKQTKRSRERGSQLVELGIVMPVILLLAFGVIEMGGLIHAHQVVSNAAREGVRLSVSEENQNATGSGPGSIAQHVQYYIITENGIACITEPTVTIDQGTFIPTPSGVSMSSSTVTVVCPFEVQVLPGLTGGAIPTVVNIQATVEFRNFY